MLDYETGRRYRIERDWQKGTTKAGISHGISNIHFRLVSRHHQDVVSWGWEKQRIGEGKDHRIEDLRNGIVFGERSES
jgi:hypothetical protein